MKQLLFHSFTDAWQQSAIDVPGVFFAIKCFDSCSVPGSFTPISPAAKLIGLGVTPQVVRRGLTGERKQSLVQLHVL